MREKMDFRGVIVPLDEWKIKLQDDFPFMEQSTDDSHNRYRKWGFECSCGWYQLLRECCEAIVARYAIEGIGLSEIDFDPAQIKEKFGTLRFYYGYKDAPCGIAAFDDLATGESKRFEPKVEGYIGDAKANCGRILVLLFSQQKRKAGTLVNYMVQKEN